MYYIIELTRKIVVVDPQMHKHIHTRTPKNIHKHSQSASFLHLVFVISVPSPFPSPSTIYFMLSCTGELHWSTFDSVLLFILMFVCYCAIISIHKPKVFFRGGFFIYYLSCLKASDFYPLGWPILKGRKAVGQRRESLQFWSIDFEPAK